jgi:membrane protein implicated in regulation of membrane protease activity
VGFYLIWFGVLCGLFGSGHFWMTAVYVALSAALLAWLDEREAAKDEAYKTWVNKVTGRD